MCAVGWVSTHSLRDIDPEADLRRRDERTKVVELVDLAEKRRVSTHSIDLHEAARGDARIGGTDTDKEVDHRGDEQRLRALGTPRSLLLVERRGDAERDRAY